MKITSEPSRDLQIVTDELLTEIESLASDEQSCWLFLVESNEFRGFWEVQGLDSSFIFDFHDLIGDYRIISPGGIDTFIDLANELEYKVGFLNDPTDILDAFAYLQEPPDFSLNSTLDNTVNGFMPWQINGYNKLIKDENLPGGYFVWLTGAGKSVTEVAAIKHYEGRYDLCLIFVKSHNKIDTQRKLKMLGNIESSIIDGSKDKRKKLYNTFNVYDDPRVVIMNYEKIREDYEEMIPMIENKRILVFFDEAPTKIGNRSTQLYKATRKFLYETFPNVPRANWMRSWALSATPVENSPDDVYSVLNLINPRVLGTVAEFHSEHVARTNMFSGKPDLWKNLDRMEAKIQFMVHRVSKEDPEVARMFPNGIEKQPIMDWNPRHKTIYDKLTGKAKELFEEDEDINILSLIQVMQMMCDAPSMIKTSAQNRKNFNDFLDNEDWDVLPNSPRGSDIALRLIDYLGEDVFDNKGHTKIEEWCDIIINKHPSSKIVTHSTWGNYIFPVWEEVLTQRGISYVIYRGSGKQKQEALDQFRNDPSIRCFLSSDAGADSIDIVEADVGINYNIPWKDTTRKQRQGRRDRVNSTFEQIYTYTLMMPNSVDERKDAVCLRKFGYHAQLFDGKAQDDALSAKLTKKDLMYIIFGQED